MRDELAAKLWVDDSSDFDISSMDGFEGTNEFDGDGFEQEIYDSELDSFDGDAGEG